MSTLLALAIAPGAFIVYKIYRQDKIEKEPVPLIRKLLIAGAVSVIPVLILEIIAGVILDGCNDMFVLSDKVYVFWDAFICTALIEEGVKYFVLKKFTWKNEEFNYTFDAIVYAVSVGMGFAIIENIEYVLANGMGNAILRALTSVPGHAVFAVYMGYYYGCARLCETVCDRRGVKGFLKKSLWIPVVIHGFYDYCLMRDNGWLVLVFFIFIIALYIITIKNIGKYSANDEAISDGVIDVAYKEEQ